MDEDTFADDPFLKVLQATVADRLRPITGNETPVRSEQAPVLTYEGVGVQRVLRPIVKGL